MTEKEMLICYEGIMAYRKDENILGYCYFKDKNFGTVVNFYIGEYKVTCDFFCIGKDNWKLCINASLKTDWKNQFLNNSIEFEVVNLLEISNTIDSLIKACQSMPPMFSSLKAEMQRNLVNQGSNINLYE